MRLKKMYDGGEVPNPHTVRQMHGSLGQDDSMSHRSVQHSYNETNTIGSASHQQSARDKAASILRTSQMSKLTQAAANSGNCRPSLYMRNGNGMTQAQ